MTLNYRLPCLLTFLAVTLVIAPLSFAQEEDGDEGDGPELCEGDTLKAGVRAYLAYVLDKNDSENDGIDEEDPGEDFPSEEDGLDSEEDDEILFDKLGKSLEQLSKTRTYLQRSPEVLISASAKSSLKAWKGLDTINWNNVAALNSETFPENLDFIFDVDDCRSFSDMLGGLTAAKLKKVTKANLKHLKASVKSLQSLLVSFQGLELVTSAEYKSINKRIKTTQTAIDKAIAKAKR